MAPPSDSSSHTRHAVLAAAAAIAIHAVPATGHAQVVSGAARRDALSADRAPKAIVPFAHPGAQVLIVGMLEGAPVYTDSVGQHFTIDRATGGTRLLDAKAVARIHTFPKIEIERKGQVPTQRAKTVSSDIRFAGDSLGGRVEIIGIDADGRTLHRNARGEVFHVDPVTGNLVFVKN